MSKKSRPKEIDKVILSSSEVILENVLDQAVTHVKEESEEPKRSIWENALLAAGIATGELNSTTNKITWSDNAPRVLGIKKQDNLGEKLEDFLNRVHPEDKIKLSRCIRRTIQQGKGFQLEYRLMEKKGASRWIASSGNAATLSHGIGFLTLLTFQDITTVKETTHELENWKLRNELVWASTGVITYDYDVLSGNILWKGEMETVVGLSPTEIGRIEKWEALIHPEDCDKANRLLESARKALTPYNVYYRFKTKHNGYRYMHDRGTFIANDQGVPVRMLGMMNDVSQQVMAEQTIQESEISYRKLFNSLNEAIYIQHLDGTFIDVNDEACALYGLRKQDLIGKTFSVLSAERKNNPGILANAYENVNEGKKQIFEWWGRKRSGEEFLMEIRLTTGFFFGKEIIIATARNITEQKTSDSALYESEKRFRRLIEDVNVGIALHGPNTAIQLVNRAALYLLGTTEDQLIGKKYAETGLNVIREDGSAFPPEEHPSSVAGKTGQPVRGVLMGVYRPVFNDRMWLLVNAEPTFMEGDRLLHVAVTFIDVTERKRVEEELKESELRFRTLQQASFGGIGLHKDGIILDCNQGLCDITGYTYAELIGKDGLELIAPEYRAEVLEKIQRRYEKTFNDVEGLRKDGSRYALEIHGKNIPYKKDFIRVVEFRDISERKNAEAQILEQNQRLLAVTEDLQVKNDQLHEFAQIVSHNLRSPVGNILALISLLEKAENEEEKNEYFKLLKESGTSTLTTLQELNEVLQIKQNKNIEKQQLEFERVFAEVKKMLNAKISECGALIQTDFSRAPQLEYPNIYLESILLNLLSNALKYADPNRKPVITLMSYTEDDKIMLSVSDNGLGINMDRYGDHIFKLRKTFHRHPESRGIGLFMIKNQIMSMGGDITVSSVEGIGTTFTIRFN